MDVITPLLIPQPRQFEQHDGRFAINDATTIVLGTPAGDATLFAARQLQAAIAEQCGVTATIVKRSGPEERNTIRLALDPPSAGTTAATAPMVAQSYTLRITPDRIEVRAVAEAGLFYGVQTLIQLLRVQGRQLHGCFCDDQPAMPHRGIMLDVSRGKVPTLETLVQLAEMLAHYKINQLQLYTEHTFQFPSHPRIGENCGSLSAADMLALDQACRERHIELVPNLQSTGHMRHILSLPEYEHLSETPWRWSITPALEESYTFLDQLYSDFLPAFSTPIINVSSDEAWDHGRGQAKDLSATMGYGGVYVQHIRRLYDLAARHGRRTMIWADVLHHYPDLIDQLPSDLILLDWWYEARDSYPSVQTLAASGRPFYVCPGTSSWNTLFPRIDNALVNTRNYVRDGLASGAIGMLLTDWGDMGHYQPLGHSFYSYLWGAEMAWGGATTATETFDQAFGALLLGDRSGRVVAAIRALGRAVEQPALATPNRSDSVYALWEDPIGGRLSRSISPEVLDQLTAAASEAIVAWARLPDPILRYELGFTAHQIIYAASKVRLGQAVLATLRELATDPTPTSASMTRLDDQIDALAQLQAELEPMMSEFERVWMLRARRGEIAINLERYVALRERFEVAITWLRGQRDRSATTGVIDAELQSYDRGDYLVLWEHSLHDLRRLVDLVGKDAVPPEILVWLGVA